MEMNEAMTNLIIAAVVFLTTVITILGPIVRTLLARWAEEKYEELQMNVPENVMQVIKEAARIAVIVVEATNLEGKGKVKLVEAEEIAENWLLSLGYDVELDMIREAIEFVLFEMKNEGKV